MEFDFVDEEAYAQIIAIVGTGAFIVGGITIWIMRSRGNNTDESFIVAVLVVVVTSLMLCSCVWLLGL